MNKKLVPMPKVGDTIYPIHGLETIAWWEKPVKPYGKFVRIVWDDSSKKHSAVCKREYTTGIVAFLTGKPPGFGDVLRVTSVGTNTCRVIAVNIYHDVLVKTLNNYNSSELAYDIEEMLINELYKCEEIAFESLSDEDALQTIAMASWGLASYMKNGISTEKRQVKRNSNEEE